MIYVVHSGVCGAVKFSCEFGEEARSGSLGVNWMLAVALVRVCGVVEISELEEEGDKGETIDTSFLASLSPSSLSSLSSLSFRFLLPPFGPDSFRPPLVMVGG